MRDSVPDIPRKGGASVDTCIVDGRVAMSAARLEAVRSGIDAWLAFRRAEDRLEQYATQLDTIEQVLVRSVDAVSETLPVPGDDPAAVYELCRTADRRTVWIERVWRYFADRFGQRDAHDVRGTCLRAADEVVWSCWRPCFAEDDADPRPALPGPVPLPFLDAVHAPEAFPVSLVPADLGAIHADAAFVLAHMRSLPVPTVRVPAAAAAEPWQMALLAHEIGHHLQSAVRLTTPFRNAVSGAVEAVGGSPQDARRWAGWSVEIFADLASVAVLGPWALWPIAELELRLPSAMATGRGAYPPAALRLRLLETAIRTAGLDPDPPWPAGFGPVARQWSADLADDRFVERVVGDGIAICADGLELADWIGLRAEDFVPGGACGQWAEWFDGGSEPTTSPSLRAPRAVLVGAVAATARSRERAPAEREALLGRIREHAYPRMVALRAPARRAAVEGIAVAADVGAALAAALATGDLPDTPDSAA